jgi:ABC-type ATPase involved in cell division
VGAERREDATRDRVGRPQVRVADADDRPTGGLEFFDVGSILGVLFRVGAVLLAVVLGEHEVVLVHQIAPLDVTPAAPANGGVDGRFGNTPAHQDEAKLGLA